MPSPTLFRPFRLGALNLDNRIIIAPMCQYSAENGRMTDWHVIHLGQLAESGAGLLTIEASAVLPEGRITDRDVGLWDDDTQVAMARTLEAVRRHSDMPIAIQLAHAGRKASTEVEWRGMGQLAPGEPGGWQTVAPSAIPLNRSDHPPAALDKEGLARVRDGFAAAARRAADIGLDAVQVHAAHGYLLHEFLSPISNRRDDEYGGSLENRMRFPLEVFDAIRDAFPAERPVSVRISGTDWIEGGWDIAQSISFCQALEARGCAAINMSSGGLSVDQKIPVAPGYQVGLARAVKAELSIPVVAVGLITDYEHAEAIVANGDADMVGLARAILYNPRWPWHAAAHLGGQVRMPVQYRRGIPRGLSGIFREPDTANE